MALRSCSVVVSDATAAAGLPTPLTPGHRPLLALPILLNLIISSNNTLGWRRPICEELIDFPLSLCIFFFLASGSMPLTRGHGSSSCWRNRAFMISLATIACPQSLDKLDIIRTICFPASEFLSALRFHFEEQTPDTAHLALHLPLLAEAAFPHQITILLHPCLISPLLLCGNRAAFTKWYAPPLCPELSSVGSPVFVAPFRSPLGTSFQLLSSLRKLLYPVLIS